MPRGGGLTEPKKLSDELADICGVKVLPICYIIFRNYILNFKLFMYTVK